MSEQEEDAQDASLDEENQPHEMKAPAPEAPGSPSAELEVIEALVEQDAGPFEPVVEVAAPAPVDRALIPERGPPQVLEAISTLERMLRGRLEALETKFDRELRAEATRERVVDRLHAELQEYKQDLLLKVQRPIFIDLIQLHDDIGKMIEARLPGEADGDPCAGLRSLLSSIQTGIEDILYRQGVEPFALEQDEFDPRRQRAVSTVPTEDAALNKTVATRLRKGFQSGERLIRPELVSVYTVRPGNPSAIRAERPERSDP
jgi:molecular chaperone GrpE